MGILNRFKQSRHYYWSCTKFADWIRGTPKPGAATGEGWNSWRKLARANSKARYWIAEEGLDLIQDILYLPVDMLYSLKYYINNRWVTRTHALTAHKNDIPRGQWRDVGNRFLPCMFNELVDFVEIELAWSNVAWSKEARAKFKPPFWGYGWMRWRTWRCPEAGLDHLRWAAELKFNDEWIDKNSPEWGKPTQQALNAQEILQLYNWWKNIYPYRRDPHDISGWTELCASRRAVQKAEDPDAGEMYYLAEEKTEEERAETRRVLDLCHKIEQEQQQEDEDMMIRLIKVRGGLWT